MSVFRRPFQRPVHRRLAFNPINPATPIDQHFVSSSDGPTVPGVQSLPAVRGKGPLDNIGLRLPRPDPSIAMEARKKRKVTMELDLMISHLHIDVFDDVFPHKHCDVRIARNNGMSTTIGASPSSRIAQNDTSLHRVNTCQRSREILYPFLPVDIALIVMLLDIQAQPPQFMFRSHFCCSTLMFYLDDRKASRQ
uniref:Uncharacterized protein n=1 Tax=Oryza glumipatula TaxID=40148 RepID=A0A0E0BVH0_9ORYZ